MSNALIREDAMAPASLPPEGHERALCLMLEEARQIALQAGLLALNAAFESAGACGEAATAAEMDAFGASAERTAREMEQASVAVERLLQQIHSAAGLTRAL